MSSIADRQNFRSAAASSARATPHSATAFWILIALFGLAAVAFGVAGSYYFTDTLTVAPYVGP